MNKSKKEKVAKVTKTVLGLAGGLCASTVVGYALNALMPSETFNIAKKVIVAIGIAGLSGVASAAVSDHIEEQVDSIFETEEAFEELVDEM